MLNGVAPIFLVYFKRNNEKSSYSASTQGSGFVSGTLGNPVQAAKNLYSDAKTGLSAMYANYSAPIPLYLDERLGVYVERQVSNLQISNEPLVTAEGTDLKVNEKCEKQRVDIDLVGKKSSPGLNIILPLFKTIYEYTLYGKDYRIAYFNDNILIFSGKLVSFNTVEQKDNDLVNISITLEVLPPEKKKKEDEEKDKGGVRKASPGNEKGPFHLQKETRLV
ncbi:hypothetical protein AAIR98_001324 [Elusimicrobium simillimum]|uniref:hypothetical protein n=1 Tax=Elusimicrobium simillimum TaxID=3143438 RepID=UPI003C6F3B8D